MQNTIDTPSFEGIVSISARSAFLSAYTGNVIVAKVGWSMVAGRSCVDGELQYLFGARYYDPELGMWTSQDPMLQLNSPYAYANNPIVFVDPDGRFITWSFSSRGFSIGFNLTPIGIPLGAGINVGWGDGASIGAYGEVGYRVGGTGLGAGAAVQQSVDYNFKHGSTSTTTTESVSASFLIFNAGLSTSQSYNFSNKQWDNNWSASAGIGIGDGRGNSLGLSLTYGGDFHGNNSFGWGLGGSYDPRTANIVGFAEDGTTPVGQELWDRTGSDYEKAISSKFVETDMPYLGSGQEVAQSYGRFGDNMQFSSVEVGAPPLPGATEHSVSVPKDAASFRNHFHSHDVMAGPSAGDHAARSGGISAGTIRPGLSGRAYVYHRPSATFYQYGRILWIPYYQKVQM